MLMTLAMLPEYIGDKYHKLIFIIILAFVIGAILICPFKLFGMSSDYDYIFVLLAFIIAYYVDSNLII